MLKNTAKVSIISAENSQTQGLLDSSKTRQLSLKLAEQSELTSQFTSKFQQQQLIIVILSLIIIALMFSQLIIWLIRRDNRSRKAYDEQDKNNDTLANPIQTKQLYQTSFNTAKKIFLYFNIRLYLYKQLARISVQI